MLAGNMRPRLRRRSAVVSLAVAFAVVGSSGAGYAAYVGTHHKHVDAEDDDAHEQIRLAPNSTTGSCGVERWSVKTGTDADAGLINLSSSTSTTIAYLGSIPAPSTLPSNNRIKPTETTVYVISATLTEYKLESDSDYHLVLSDGNGHTMIGEIPDPACVGSSSPLLPGIRNARSEFDAKYNATGSFQTANTPVTIKGVGFFDYNHGQTGVAPNAIELHAVLDVQFGSGGGGGGGGGTQLIGNPGFENGSSNPAPWSVSSGVINSSSSEPPATGSWDAWFDGYGTTHTDTASQTVTIPSTASTATLTFYLHIDTAETTTSTAYDTYRVQLLNSSGSVLTTLATYSNLNHNTGYSPHSFSVIGYKGQTVTLKFTGTEDGSYQTSFVLDDVTLNVS